MSYVILTESGTDIVDDIAYSLLFFNRINHQCVPVLSNYIAVKT